MSDVIFCRLGRREINRRDCYPSKNDPSCQVCKHLKERIESRGHKRKTQKKAFIPKLDKLPIDNSPERAKALEKKNSPSTMEDIFKEDPRKRNILEYLGGEACKPGRTLYRVRACVKDNLRRPAGKTETIKKIFQDNYNDPAGAEYWRGWFDQPNLSVLHFVKLLGIHGAADYAAEIKSKIEEPDNKKFQGFGQDYALKGYPSPMQKDMAIRKEVIELLQEAAKTARLRKLLEIEGDPKEGLQALLRITPDSMEMGRFWDRRDNKQRSLTQVWLNPRETLRWFAECPERAVLLPESLLAWRPTENTPVPITPIQEPAEKAIQVSKEKTSSGKPIEQPLVGYKDIGKFLGVKIQTIEKSYKRQGVPIYREKNRRVWALPSELMDWKKSRSTKNRKRKQAE